MGLLHGGLGRLTTSTVPTRLACFLAVRQDPFPLDDTMASKTAVTEYRRKIRRKNAGGPRKAKLRNQGTTPVFPIHTP